MDFNLPESRALFLVWASPTHGSSRSREFSKELEIEELHYVYTVMRAGAFTAPLRYTVQALQTLRLLFAKRPRVVFVQSPPSFAVLFVYFFCRITGGQYIVDAHSGAFDLPIWTHPKWLVRFLARKALATIVTGEHYKQLVTMWGGNAIVLKDPVTTYPLEVFPLNDSFKVAVVNTFSSDEPLEEVLKAAAELSEVQFYVTGKKSRAGNGFLSQAPPNVHFTDYLPAESYYGLLSSSDAVMCLTTQDHTLQCGACEALSLGKPIITSDWPLLREYFHQGTVHVPNTHEGIRNGVITMRQNYEELVTEIKALRMARKTEWRTQVERLIHLIERSTSTKIGCELG